MTSWGREVGHISDSYHDIMGQEVGHISVTMTSWGREVGHISDSYHDIMGQGSRPYLRQ